MADTARKITAESLHARLPVGEVARFDEQLVARFHLLHEETGELATPPVFVAFDCMWRRGRDLRGAPLADRRLADEEAPLAADLDLQPACRQPADVARGLVLGDKALVPALEHL